MKSEDPNYEITEKEKDILMSYTGMETLKQIGDRYNITPERVRQIMHKALSRVLGFYNEFERH